MTTRPASEPASVPVGIVLLCGLALVTGWLLLRGAPFVVAIPAMGGIVVASVLLLVRRPRVRR